MSVCIPNKIPSNLFRTRFHFVKSNEIGATFSFQRIFKSLLAEIVWKYVVSCCLKYVSVCCVTYRYRNMHWKALSSERIASGMASGRCFGFEVNIPQRCIDKLTAREWGCYVRLSARDVHTQMCLGLTSSNHSVCQLVRSNEPRISCKGLLISSQRETFVTCNITLTTNPKLWPWHLLLGLSKHDACEQ
jgi:hypothetical protein